MALEKDCGAGTKVANCAASDVTPSCDSVDKQVDSCTP
jgi:hypothetical protein